jgi:hypothetical protein
VVPGGVDECYVGSGRSGQDENRGYAAASRGVKKNSNERGGD